MITVRKGYLLKDMPRSAKETIILDHLSGTPGWKIREKYSITTATLVRLEHEDPEGRLIYNMLVTEVGGTKAFKSSQRRGKKSQMKTDEQWLEIFEKITQNGRLDEIFVRKLGTTPEAVRSAIRRICPERYREITGTKEKNARIKLSINEKKKRAIYILKSDKTYFEDSEHFGMGKYWARSFISRDKDIQELVKALYPFSPKAKRAKTKYDLETVQKACAIFERINSVYWTAEFMGVPSRTVKYWFDHYLGTDWRGKACPKDNGNTQRLADILSMYDVHRNAEVVARLMGLDNEIVNTAVEMYRMEK